MADCAGGRSDAVQCAFRGLHSACGGGRYANYLVFDEDTVGKHTIEITCNSGTLYLGGLFVS